MRFLVEAQLPPALARWLASRGHEAEHVADQRMATASDRAIWEYAIGAAAAIITKDEDFAQRKALGMAVLRYRLTTHSGALISAQPTATLLSRNHLSLAAFSPQGGGR